MAKQSLDENNRNLFCIKQSAVDYYYGLYCYIEAGVNF